MKSEMKTKKENSVVMSYQKSIAIEKIETIAMNFSCLLFVAVGRLLPCPSLLLFSFFRKGVLYIETETKTEAMAE